jgi:gliding motility-associated-like protein
MSASMHRTALLITTVILSVARSVGGAPERGVFVRNDGQWPTAVQYRAGSMLGVYLEASGITWSQMEPDASHRLHDFMHLDDEAMKAFTVRGHAWHVDFVGADPNARWQGVQPGTEHLNFLLGNDPSKWAGHVPVFARALNADLWPGVDLVMRIEGASFKYDLLLERSLDVELIRFAYSGPDAMRIDATGSLIIGTSVGNITEAAPVAFYADGTRETIPCRYVLNGNTVGFIFDGPVDAQRAIVIDPVVLAATYSGTGDLGLTENYGGSATYSADGSIFTGAHCFDQGYPTTPGAFQLNFPGGPYSIAISKLNADGSNRLWATYLGGNGNDTPASMIEDTDGTLVIMGTSNSDNYPCTPNAFDDSWGGGFIYRDIVVSRLSPDGSTLIGSTYVGGVDDDGWNGLQANLGDHVMGEVILDAAGDIYVCNTSSSPDFPVSPNAVQTVDGGMQDAVVFKLNYDASALLWSTRMGGIYHDVASGLHLDGTGGVYVVGSAADNGMPFGGTGYQPSFAGSHDGFIAHLVNDGTAIAGATYLGGADFDLLQRVDIDPQGRIYVLGQHPSPITVQPAGTFSTATGSILIARFSPDLNSLDLMTRVAEGMSPNSFLVDACGKVYISGYYPDGPLTADALQTDPGGFYVGLYDVDVSAHLFGTNFGLQGEHLDAGMSRFTPEGVLYQAGCEDGWPGTYATTPNAWSTTPATSYDVVVFKMELGTAGNGLSAQFTATASAPCAPTEFTFDNTGGGTSWTWDFGDNTATSALFEPTHTYTQPGTYTVTLIAMDPNACVPSDTVQQEVVIGGAGGVTVTLSAVPAGTCTDLSVAITASATGDNLLVEWSLGDGTAGTGMLTTHTYPNAGSYTITLTATDTLCGGTDQATEQVQVGSGLAVDLGPDTVACPGTEVLLTAGPVGATYVWSSGANASSIEVGPGLWWVDVSLNGCLGTDTITVAEATLPSVPDPDPLCPGESIALSLPPGSQDIVWWNGSTSATVVLNESGTYTYAGNSTDGCPFAGAIEVMYVDANDGLYVPNAFTPNGDGINDVFAAVGAAEEISLRILNRWGEEVFSSDLPIWDGTYHGAEPKEDIYIYTLSYHAQCGTGRSKVTGHVTLLR